MTGSATNDVHLTDRLDKFEDRVEGKIDKITEALTVLVRIDEKMIQQQEAVNRSYGRMNKIDERMNRLSEKINLAAELGRKNEIDIAGFKNTQLRIAGVFTAVITAIIIKLIIN